MLGAAEREGLEWAGLHGQQRALKCPRGVPAVLAALSPGLFTSTVSGPLQPVHPGIQNCRARSSCLRLQLLACVCVYLFLSSFIHPSAGQ